MNKPRQSVPRRRKIPNLQPKTLAGGRHPPMPGTRIPHLARASEPNSHTRTSKPHRNPAPAPKKEGKQAIYLGRDGRTKAAAIARGGQPSRRRGGAFDLGWDGMVWLDVVVVLRRRARERRRANAFELKPFPFSVSLPSFSREEFFLLPPRGLEGGSGFIFGQNLCSLNSDLKARGALSGGLITHAGNQINGQEQQLLLRLPDLLLY